MQTQAKGSACCTAHQLQGAQQLRATHRNACSLLAQTRQSACSRSGTRSRLHFAANLANYMYKGSSSGTAAPANGGRLAALMTRTGCAHCRWQPAQLSSSKQPGLGISGRAATSSGLWSSRCSHSGLLSSLSRPQISAALQAQGLRPGLWRPLLISLEQVSVLLEPNAVARASAPLLLSLLVHTLKPCASCALSLFAESSAVLSGHQRLQVIQQEDALLACLVEEPCDDKQPRLPVTGSLWGVAQQLRVLVKHANEQQLHNCESKEFKK